MSIVLDKKNYRRLNIITLFMAAIIGVVIIFTPKARAVSDELPQSMLRQIETGAITTVINNLTDYELIQNPHTITVNVAGVSYDVEYGYTTSVNETPGRNDLLNYITSSDLVYSTFTDISGVTSVDMDFWSGDLTSYMGVAKNGEVPNLINVVCNGCAVIGILWAIVIAAGHMMQNLDRGMPFLEAFCKIGKELIFVILIIFNLPEILEVIYRIGNYIIGVVLDGVTQVFQRGTHGMGIDLHEGSRELNGSYSITEYYLWFGIEDFLETVLKLFIPWLCSYICEGVALLMSYSLLIDLGVRKAFCPIQAAEIYGEGLRSNGVRYFKKYLASYIKIAVAVMVAAMGSIMMGLVVKSSFDGGELSGVFEYLLKIVIINFTVISLIGKTGEQANDIVGV